MKIKFSPQYDDKQVKYTVDGQVLTLEINDETSVLDFKGLPDGEMQEPQYPINNCRKENGVVFIELLTPYEGDAPKEILFPSSEYQEMTGVIYSTIKDGDHSD